MSAFCVSVTPWPWLEPPGITASVCHGGLLLCSPLPPSVRQRYYWLPHLLLLLCTFRSTRLKHVRPFKVRTSVRTFMTKHAPGQEIRTVDWVVQALKIFETAPYNNYIYSMDRWANIFVFYRNLLSLFISRRWRRLWGRTQGLYGLKRCQAIKWGANKLSSGELRWPPPTKTFSLRHPKMQAMQCFVLLFMIWLVFIPPLKQHWQTVALLCGSGFYPLGISTEEKRQCHKFRRHFRQKKSLCQHFLGAGGQ